MLPNLFHHGEEKVHGSCFQQEAGFALRHILTGNEFKVSCNSHEAASVAIFFTDLGQPTTDFGRHIVCVAFARFVPVVPVRGNAKNGIGLVVYAFSEDHIGCEVAHDDHVYHWVTPFRD
jgi:hypothetical protein